MSLASHGGGALSELRRPVLPVRSHSKIYSSIIEGVNQPDAAVAIVHAREPEPAVLLIRRSERDDDPWSGHWSFPGGRRDDADPDLLHTALRELEEECGVRLDRSDCEGGLPASIARRHAGRFLLVAPFFFAVPRQLDTVLDPREAAGALWVPESVLRDTSRHRLRAVPGRPAHTLFPAVELEGPPLWGFTYRLLTEWLALAPDSTDGPAGFAAAQRVLAFLLSRGMTLQRGWTASGSHGKSATVGGSMPVEAVLAHFAAPGRDALAMNRLEVYHESVRVAGLNYEEYVIEAVAES